MSLTDGKNILVYVETAQGAQVGPALEILAKAKELAAAKGEEVIAAILAEAPEEAAKTAVEAGADQAVIVKTAESRPEKNGGILWIFIHHHWCWQQLHRRAKMSLRCLHRNLRQDALLMS